MSKGSFTWREEGPSTRSSLGGGTTFCSFLHGGKKILAQGSSYKADHARATYFLSYKGLQLALALGSQFMAQGSLLA